MAAEVLAPLRDVLCLILLDLGPPRILPRLFLEHPHMLPRFPDLPPSHLPRPIGLHLRGLGAHDPLPRGDDAGVHVLVAGELATKQGAYPTAAGGVVVVDTAAGGGGGRGHGGAGGGTDGLRYGFMLTPEEAVVTGLGLHDGRRLGFAGSSEERHCSGWLVGWFVVPQGGECVRRLS